MVGNIVKSLLFIGYIGVGYVWKFTGKREFHVPKAFASLMGQAHSRYTLHGWGKNLPAGVVHHP